MPEDFKRHTLHYSILFLILAFGFLGFWYFSYNPLLKRSVILVMVASYLAWGIIHHLVERNLNFKIVVEYILVTILAATVLLLVIGGSA